MIIYKCRFTGDEMCSDAFKPAPVMEDGAEVGGLFKIESQKVNKVRAVVSYVLEKERNRSEDGPYFN
jgi:hypothetical protein